MRGLLAQLQLQLMASSSHARNATSATRPRVPPLPAGPKRRSSLQLTRCMCASLRSAYGAPRGAVFPPAFDPRMLQHVHAHGFLPPPAPALRAIPQGHTVKMRGLPFRALPQDVYSFFAGFALVPDTLQLGSDALGRPSGEGWLTFATPEEAERAARERNRAFIGSRFIELTVV